MPLLHIYINRQRILFITLDTHFCSTSDGAVSMQLFPLTLILLPFCIYMSCTNNGSARSIDQRLRCAIDGSLASATIARSRNHPSIAPRYLWIGLSTFVLIFVRKNYISMKTHAKYYSLFSMNAKFYKINKTALLFYPKSIYLSTCYLYSLLYPTQAPLFNLGPDI